MFKRNAPVLRVIAMTLVMALSIFATMTMLGCVDHTNTSDEATLKTVISQLEDLKKKILELDDKLKLIYSQIDALTKAMEEEDADLEEIQQELLKLQEELEALEAEELKDRYLTDLKVQSNLIKGLSDNGIVETSAAQNTHDELNDTLSNSISETLEDISDALSDAQERLEELMEGEEEEEEPPQPVSIEKVPEQTAKPIGVIGSGNYTGGDEGGDSPVIEAVKIVCPYCQTEGVIHKCQFCDGYTCDPDGHERGVTKAGTPCAHVICHRTDKVDPAHRCQYGCISCATDGTHNDAICGGFQNNTGSSNISTVSEDTTQLNGYTFFSYQPEEGQQATAVYPACQYCGQPADYTDGIHSYLGQCNTHQGCTGIPVSPDHNTICPNCNDFVCKHSCQ